MRVTAPITSYIGPTDMPIQGDLVVKGAALPQRLPAGADKTYFQGKGAGVIPAYGNQMPPLTTQGDIIMQGAAVPERLYISGTIGKVLTVTAGSTPGWISLFNLLTTRGDLWVRGVANPQRLAAGLLDTYLKAQGSGNLPIYEKLALRDTGVKIGSAFRNSSGVQVITGVGFQPSLVIALARDGVVANINLSWGAGIVGSNQCIFLQDNAAGVNNDNSNVVYIRRSGANYMFANISAVSSGGFSMSWTLTGAVSLEYIYICLP